MVRIHVMEPLLRQRLLLLNPWQRDPACFADACARHLPATLVARHQPPLSGDVRKAVLVIGPRQVGKSTWLWAQLRQRPPASVLLLHAEEPLVRGWCASPWQVLEDLSSEFPAVRTLLIEEAHHLREAGLFIKGLVDAKRGLEVLVTGSSGFHLGSRTRESLAGRAARRRLLPLSVAELLDHANPPVGAARTSMARQIADRQMVFGSYPDPWMASDPAAELAELLEASVLRDASDRFHIERVGAFRQLVQLAARQIGQQVNYSEWAAHLGVSGPTVRDWLGLLEESHVLALPRPFAGGRRQEVTRAGRVHFIDPGLRNAALLAFSTDLALRPDLGPLTEGWAFAELARCLPAGWDIRFWRTKGGAEVDFVLVHGDRTIGVEIKAGAPARVGRSARSFIDAYRPLAFVVAGRYSERRDESVDGTGAIRVPLHGLAAVVAEIAEASGG